MSNPISYFRGVLRQKSGPIGVLDPTLPTFAGVQSVTPNNDGSFSVSWNFGSTTKTPLRYEIYVAPGVVSAASLFSTDNNVVQIEPDHINNTRVFTLADDSTYFVNGQTYTFGVRAVDAFGFEGGPATVITSTAIASGNLPSIFQTIVSNLQSTHVDFQADHTNFQADHANFQADHANFQLDRNNVTNLTGDINSADTLIGYITEDVP